MRKWLLRKVATHLFRAIEVNDFFDIKKFKKEEREALQKEAEMILRSKVWTVLTSDMIRVAEKKMFIESRNETDMIFGKAVLYTLELINKKLYNITISK